MTTQFLLPKLLFLAPLFCLGQIKNTCLESKSTTFKDGKITQETIKKYNKSNLLIVENKSFFNPSIGNYTEEILYTYDKDGNNSGVTYARNGKVFQEKINQFSKSKKLIQSASKINNIPAFRSVLLADSLSREDIYLEENGTKEGSREKFTFDISGNLLSKELKNAQGKSLIKQTYSYNSLGKITVESLTDASDNSVKITTYSYHSSGILLSDKTTLNGLTLAETKFVYDNNNNLSKKIRLNGKGIEEYYHLYEYNTQGNILKEVYFYGNQPLSSHLYEYDTAGNIIKEILLDRTGKVFSEIKREFICP